MVHGSGHDSEKQAWGTLLSKVSIIDTGVPSLTPGMCLTLCFWNFASIVATRHMAPLRVGNHKFFISVSYVSAFISSVCHSSAHVFSSTITTVHPFKDGDGIAVFRRAAHAQVLRRSHGSWGGFSIECFMFNVIYF